MPTPATSARELLTPAAGSALDAAVALSVRRHHPQTTSLHLLSTLLSSPLLRDAVSSHRKPLHLSFCLSLDRLPPSSPSPSSVPLISNSLMAAIKRSQATQRRFPETCANPEPVKVELKQLVMAVLDDPVVSRVFAEVGLRSGDVKVRILRPVRAQMFGFEKGTGFKFPFSRGVLFGDVAEENCRRIGEVLGRKEGRNVLLIGAGAEEAEKDLKDAIGRKNWSVLPPEVAGVKYFEFGEDVGRERGWIEGRIGELSRVLEVERGVVLGVGDFKGFVEGGDSQGVDHVVSELGRLVGFYGRRLWLVGTSASYETYMKFLARYPSVDKEWDLQILPITSVKAGSPGSSSKPRSLIDSFVPFGGFFSTTSSSVIPCTKPPHAIILCDHCNWKYREEADAILKEHSFSNADLQNASFPPLLEKAPAKDDGEVVDSKLIDLQKKWNDICYHLHRGSNLLQAKPPLTEPESVSLSVRIPGVSDIGLGEKSPTTTRLEPGSGEQKVSPPVPSNSLKENVFPEIELRLSSSERPKTSHLNSSSSGQSDNHNQPLPLALSRKDLNLGSTAASPCKVIRPTPRVGGLSGCFLSKNSDMFSGSGSRTLIESLFDGSSDVPIRMSMPLTLPNSTSKVTKDYASIPKNREHGSSTMSPQIDLRDLKALSKSLIEKVGRQEEAIYAVSEAITRSKAGNGGHGAHLKGDTWLNFQGPDMVGKKRVAKALAELLFGSKEKFFCVDLTPQDGEPSQLVIHGKEDGSGSDGNIRGQMVIDRIAEQIRKMPLSVVLLENVDKADFLVQNSLSQAVTAGRFPDSHGREISISNTIFVTTTSQINDKNSSQEQNATFHEERIVATKRCKLKILVEADINPQNKSSNVDSGTQRDLTSQHVSPCNFLVNKRKLNNYDGTKELSDSMGAAKRAHKLSNTFLDLNVPFEETVSNDAQSSSEDSNLRSTDDSTWLEDFLSNVDKTVIFKPFDFDKLAENILNEITKNFQSLVRSKCRLQIDPKAMDQMIAATWLLEGMKAMTEWAQKVLWRSFIEVGERYNPSDRSVVHLVACEDAFFVDHAPGILLPSTIILN